MKKGVHIMIASLLVVLVGCESKGSEVSELPEVNDENCLHENMKKMTPGETRNEFASLCLRRFNFKPSERKEW
jgi:entry exclusion lipoprotein TrbK